MSRSAKRFWRSVPAAAVRHVSPPVSWEDFTPLDVSAGGVFVLRNDTDYKIVGQSAPSNVRLRGGRKVVIIGLTVTVANQNWTTLSEAETTGLEFQENPYTTSDPPRAGGAPSSDREFYAEGVLLNGSELTQGIRLNCPTAAVTLVNIHVAEIRFHSNFHRDGKIVDGLKYVTNHPDLIQSYGGMKSLTIDGFTGYSMYQGFFFKEDLATVNGPISLRRVDLHAFEAADTVDSAYRYAGHVMLWNYQGQPIACHDDTVWIEGHIRNGWQPRTAATSVNGTGFHYVRRPQQIADPDNTVYTDDLPPSAAQHYMTVGIGTDPSAYGSPALATDSLGQYATYPSSVSGKIRFGIPLSGEYVPATSVGSSYQIDQ